ncbi:hypothetical protein ANN_20544, partial [Periplaneta americana]
VTMAPTKREHARSQVQALVKTGKSVCDIARLLKMSPTTVLKWKNQTDGSVSDAKRSGRPSKVLPQTKRKNKGVGEGQEDAPAARILRAHILFTDESFVELHSIPNRQNARIRTADPSSIKPTQVPKFGVKIMVAGGISRYGKTQLIIMEPEPTAKSILDTIKNSGIKVWTDCPGNSPDLNPIEHLWSRLQESVFRTPRPRNRNELIARVLEEWESITQEDIFRLTDSFGRRVLQCLEKKD